MLDIPESFDWSLWRIAGAERFSSGLIEIETEWTIADVELAHIALDIIEDNELLAMPKPKPKK